MRFGIHAMVLAGGWTREDAETAIGTAARLGYEVIEIPLFDPGGADLPHTRALLERHGLQATASLGLTRETDVSSPDAAVAAAGVRQLVKVVDAVADLGGKTVAGVIGSAWTRYWAQTPPAGYENAVSSLREVAQHAAGRGVTLAVESVNRFESNLFNTAVDGLRLLDRIGEDNVGLHLDSFHMHIEEPDAAASIELCGDRLAYFHINESHRGYLGTGAIAFAPMFRALARIGYDGVVAFEAFSSAVTPPEVAGLAAIWRDVFSDGPDLAERALAFMREEAETAARTHRMASR